MCKINFDTVGNPTPYQIVPLSKDECEKCFVTDFPASKTRVLNWRKYNLYLNDLTNYLVDPLKQWIAGSFTTTKVDPNDIDLVNFISHENFNPDLNMFNMKKGEEFPKRIYNIDGYNVFVFPSTHPYYAKMIEQTTYWNKQFGSDRDDNPKALIEVRYP